MRNLIKYVFALSLAFTVFLNDAFSQCSPVPIVETVDNGSFEKGYPKTGTNGTQYNDGSPVIFKSGLSYAGDWSPTGTCYYSIADKWGIGRQEAGPVCLNGPVNSVPYGAGYITTPWKDHTLGTTNGMALLVDFNTFCTSGQGKLYPGALPAAWAQDVNITPAQTYYFSNWIAQYNRNATDPSNISTLYFVVTPYAADGVTLLTSQRVIVGTMNPAQVVMNWQQFYGTWNSGTYTKALISIEVDGSQTNCNSFGDFAIDDISFINGCQSVANSSLKPNLGSNFSFCQTNGSYTLNSQVATNPSDPRQFSWYSGSGPVQTTLVNASTSQNTFTISAPGTYRVCVSDVAVGTCAISSTIVIDNSMSVVVTGNDLCSPVTSVMTATVTPPATTAAYNYSWTGASPNPGNVASFTASSAGTYGVTATNSAVSGCTATGSKTIVSTLPTAPTNLTYCDGGGTATNLTVGDGKKYLWYKDAAKGALTGTVTGNGTVTTSWTPTAGTTGDQTLYLVSNETTPLAGSPLQTAAFQYDGGAGLGAITITVTQTVSLASITMKIPTYGYATGSINLSGAATKTQAFPASPNTGANIVVPLNWNLTPGTYTLTMTANGGAYIAPTIATTSIAGFVSISGSNSPFMNMVFQQSAACDPIPVIVKAISCCTKPVITTQLSAKTVCVGATATFGPLGLSPIPASTVVKWQKTTDTTNAALFTDIANTTTSLTTAATVTGDNGTWYRAVTVSTPATCTKNSWWVKLTVNPNPTVNAVTTTAICSGSATNIALVSTPTGATFSWTRAAVAGITPATGSGSTTPIAETLTSTNSSATTVTYSVTATANTCTGAAQTITQVVNPKPTVNTVTTTAVCSGSATSIALTSPTAGASFSWTRAAVTGITPATGTGSTTPIAEILTSTNTSATTVTYSVTATANGCTGVGQAITQVVNPAPAVNTVTTTAICSGSSTNIALTSATAGATFAWTRAAVTGITPATGTGSTTPIAETLTSTNTSATTVTYSVTATANGCTGTAQAITQVVNPAPTVNTVTTTAICSGSSTNIALTSSTAGATFAWTRAAVAGITPATGSGSATPIAETLTSTNTSATTVTYSVTATAIGCKGPAQTITQVVTPSPTVNTVTTTAICSGSATSIALTSPTAGATFSWTRAAVAGITPATGTGSASPIAETLTSTNTSATTVTYSVTATSGTCTGPAQTITQVVNPAPTVNTVTTTAICSGGATNIALTSPTAGVTFAWTRAAVAGITPATGTGSTTPIAETLTSTNTSATTVTYSVKATANTCTGAAQTITQVINPAPTVNAVTTTAICSGSSTNIALTSSTAGATFAWTRAAVAGITPATGTGSTTPIAETLTSTNTSATTVTYSVSATANGCTGVGQAITQTVTPSPTVNTVTTTAICSGSATSIALTSPTAGATFAWTRAAVAGITPATGSGSITPIAETLTSTNTSATTVTYSVKASAGTCTGPAQTITQVVNPAPIVNTVTTTAICSGSPTNIALTSPTAGATFAWTRAAVAGITPATGSGSTNPVAETLTSTNTSATTVTYSVTATANTCTGTAQTITQVINPAPTVNPVTTTAICSGSSTSIALTSSTAGATFTWTRAAVTGITPSTGSGSATPIAETLTSTNTSATTVTYSVNATANGCTGPAQTITQVVTPAPTVNTVTTTAICSGGTTNISLTSPTAGATFAWTRAAVAGITPATGTGSASPIAETLTSANTSAATVTYLVKASAGTCTGPAQTITQVVSPTPTVNTVTTTAICSGSPTNISLTSPTAGATFAWTRAAVAGITSATGSGSTSPVAETLTSTNTSATTVTYSVIATANTCAGPAQTITQVINPTPTISSALTGSTCNGAGFSYTITSATSGATFTWSRAAVVGILPATASGTTSAISENLTSSNTASTNVTYVLTPGANGCTGTPSNLIVSVGPPPTITSPLTAIICSGNPLNYTITSSNTLAALTWDRAAVTGISNAALSGQTSNPITEALMNTTTAAVTVTYKLTPTVVGCLGVPSNLVVTVNPSPTVNPVTTAAICSGASTNIALTSSTSGAAFAWTRAAVTGITPATGSGSTTPIAETLTNSTTDPITVTYLATGSANGCTGAAQTITQVVNPKPTISSVLTGSTCNGAGFSYTITSATTGATFTWTRAAVSGITPATGSGSTSAISETLASTNTTNTSVTYVLTSSANGCAGTPSNLIVTVGPPPTITSPLTATVCSGVAMNYTITASNPGATLTWDRAAVTGITNTALSGQTSNPITEILDNTTTSPVSVTYKLTPTVTGCTSTTSNLVVTVNPKPTVTVTTTPANGEICNGGSATLKGAGASTYTWDNGVVDGTAFSPTATKIYTVTGTDANSCTNTATATITVNPLPVITPLTDTKICSGSATQLQNLAADIANSTFTYTATTSNAAAVTGFSAANAGTSVTSIPSETITSTSTVQEDVAYVITANSPKGCVSASTITYKVLIDAPAVAKVTGTNLSSCLDPQTLPGSQPPAGQTVQWNTVSGNGTITDPTLFNSTISLGAGQSGTFTMTVTSGLCTATSPVVTVARTTNENPSVGLSVDNTHICEGTAVTFTASPNGGNSATRTFEFFDATTNTSLGAPSLNATFVVSNPAANLSVYVQMVANSSCLAPGGNPTPVSGNVNVVVDKNPDQPVITQGNKTICVDNYALDLGTSVTVGTATWSSTPGATFTPITGTSTSISNLQVGTSYVVLVTNKNGSFCATKTATVTITRSGTLTTPNATADGPACYSATGHVFNLTGNAVNTLNNETSAWTAKAGNIYAPSQTGNNATANVLLPGTYTYVYTISNGGICADATQEVSVTLLQNVDLTSNVTGNEVCGSNPTQAAGNTTVTIVTPQIGATYTVYASGTTINPLAQSPAATSTNPLSISISVNALQDGAQSLDVYANLGGTCKEQLLLQHPTVTKVGVIADIPSYTFCADTTTGKALSWTASSTGAAAYSWSASPALSNPVYYNKKQTVSAVWGNVSGSITVTPMMSDSTMCTQLSKTGQITVIPKFGNTEVLDQLNASVCQGDAVPFNIKSPSANTTYTYAKPADATGTSIVNNAFTVNFQSSGAVTVTRTYNACPAYKPTDLTATVNVITRPVAVIVPVQTQPSLNPIVLNASKSTPPAGTSGYTYTWTAIGGDILSNGATANPKVKPSELTSTYQLTISTGSASCSSTASVTVVVRVNLNFPNVFTPNGDGSHDLFVVKNSELFPGATMEIFNQWGDKVYNHKGLYGNSSPDNCWDGTNSGAPLPVATYYYIYTPNEDGYSPVAGSISILR